MNFNEMNLSTGERKGEIYFADRHNSIFHAPEIEFRDKHDVRCLLKNTLLDGEMLIDVDKNTGARRPRYLIYYAVLVNGKSFQFEDFSVRRERIRTDIIEPRNEAAAKGSLNKEREPFSIRRKDFWPVDVKNVGRILSTGFQNKLDHETDGLIFQPNMLQYMSGRCDSVLTWKPANAVKETLRNPVTQDNLMEFISKQSYRKPDEMHMPPPPPNQYPPQPPLCQDDCTRDDTDVSALFIICPETRRSYIASIENSSYMSRVSKDIYCYSLKNSFYMSGVPKDILLQSQKNFFFQFS